MSRGAGVEGRRRGRPAKGGENKPYALRLPSDLKQQLQHYVVDHPGTSLNTIIVEAVRRWWSGVPERHRYARLVEDAVKRKQE